MATQICDRVITYRNFNYAAAETIIQEEQYLDQEDFDDIRFLQRNGNIIDNIEKVERKYESNSFENFFADFKKGHHRTKRQSLIISSYLTNLAAKLMCLESKPPPDDPWTTTTTVAPRITPLRVEETPNRLEIFSEGFWSPESPLGRWVTKLGVEDKRKI